MQRVEWVAIRIALFLALWSAVHFLILPSVAVLMHHLVPGGRRSIVCTLIERVSAQAQQSNDARKLLNLRRHFRSELYCLFAFPMGVYLLCRYYRNWPHDLLYHWNLEISISFEIAASYWMFSFYEDIACNEETIAHMKLVPGENLLVQRDSYMFGLYGHHTVTLIAYFWALVTQRLSGLCVFGLLFEGPVLLMNIRDVMAAFEKELGNPYQYLQQRHVVQYNVALLVVFLLCRTMSCLTWPVSLILWLRAIGKLSTASQVILHYLGASFTYVNFLLLYKYVYRYYLDDLTRVGALSELEYWRLMKVGERKIAAAVASIPGAMGFSGALEAQNEGEISDAALSDAAASEVELAVRGSAQASTGGGVSDPHDVQAPTGTCSETLSIAGGGDLDAGAAVRDEGGGDDACSTERCKSSRAAVTAAAAAEAVVPETEEEADEAAVTNALIASPKGGPIASSVESAASLGSAGKKLVVKRNEYSLLPT